MMAALKKMYLFFLNSFFQIRKKSLPFILLYQTLLTGCSEDVRVNFNLPSVQKVTSINNENHIHKPGEKITVVVEFTKPITLSDKAQITLAFDNGADSQALYKEGSGTNTIHFEYTVKDGDFTSALNYKSVIITNAAATFDGNVFKELQLPAPDSSQSLKSNKVIKIDGIPPATPLLARSSPLSNVGKVNTVQLTASNLVIGETIHFYSDGNCTNLNRSETISGLTQNLQSDVLLPGKYFLSVKTEDLAGNQSSCSSSVDYEYDNSLPTIQRVFAFSPNGTYTLGQDIFFIVEFSEPVFGTGIPTFNLNTLPFNNYASYQSGFGTNQLTFKYTVAAGDNSALLDYTSSSAFFLNGGNIYDAALNPLVLTLPVPGAPGSLSVESQIIVNTTPASVSPPSSITLITPSTNISNDPAPSFNVNGLASGDTVSIYLNNACSGTAYQSKVSAGASEFFSISTALSEGAHGIYARRWDSGGNASACSSVLLNYVYDNTPPTVTGLASDPTPKTSKSWSWGCSDNTAPCTYRSIITPNPAFIFTTEVYGGLTTDSQLSGNGTYYLYVQAKDSANNESLINKVSVVLNNVPPTVTVNGPSLASANSLRTINYTVNVTDAATITLSPSDITWTGASVGCLASISGTGNTSRTISVSGCSGEGTMQLSVNANAAQSSSGVASAASNLTTNILIDNTAPINPSLIINGGAADTSNLNVTLTLAASDAQSGVYQMYISTAPDCSIGGTWENFAPSKNWTLSNPGTTNNIYVKFSDQAGNSSACVGSSIVHVIPQSTILAGTNLVPSDGLAKIPIYLLPRDTSGNIMGAGQTIEVTVNSSNVTLSDGAGACRVVAATCMKATHVGSGFYTVSASSAVVGNYSFSAVIAGTPDHAITPNISITFDTSQFTTISANTTITKVGYENKNLYFTGGIATFDASTVSSNNTSFGHFFVRGGTLKHLATTNTVVNKLDLVVASLTMQNGSLDASALGYINGYSYGPTGPSTALSSGYYSGASHGGMGALVNTYIVGPTYDSYRNPSLPGAGSGGNVGGGVIRITSVGTCTINNGATIKANAAVNTAAGGSIYLKCAGFAGSAAANAITANGGDGVVKCVSGCWYQAGGGGGRIALISTGDTYSFSGSFAYPNNTTSLTSFKSVVRAIGGSSGNASAAYGGAGTIYLAHSGSSYGDLIVDNGLTAPMILSITGTTFLPSVSGTVNGAPSGSVLPITVTSSPALTTNYNNLYAGLTLRPNLNFINGTPTFWADDNILTISANDGTSLTTTANISGVSSGDVFRSIDILDHIDVGGGAILESNGDIFVADYLLSAPGVSNVTFYNALFKFSGLSSTNLNYSINLTAGNFTLDTISVPQNLTLSGGSTTFNSLSVPGNFSITGGTHTIFNVTSQQGFNISNATLTSDILNITGDANFTGTAKLKHSATTTTVIHSLITNVSGNLNLSNTSSIDVTGLGYPAGYSYGPNGPSTALKSLSGSGASHGGMGGKYSTFAVGPTYDSYRNPTFPGAGGGLFAGGGTARITTSGTCTINSGATIKADGGSASAGGSIYLKCGGFAGSAAANAITANGGAAFSSCSVGCYYLAAGGGGRVALISTGDSSSFIGSFAYPNNITNLTAFKNVVRTLGGAAINGSLPGGGAGTIYLSYSGSNYGDLIVDNGLASPTIYTNSGTTFLPSLSGTVNGAPAGNVLPVTVTSSPALTADYNYLYANLSIRPNLSFNNGTINNWADDNVLSVISNDGTSLTLSTAISGASSGNSFRSIDIFDHIDIGGGAIVESNGDIFVGDYLLSAPGVSNVTFYNALFKFSGLPNTNLNYSVNLTAGSFTLDTIPVPQNLTLSGGTHTFTSLSVPGNFSITSGTHTIPTITSQQGFNISNATLTSDVLNITGDANFSGTAKLKHSATTTTVVHRLITNISGNLNLNNTSSIDVTGLGYPAGYSYGPNGPSPALKSLSSSGASHGGTGGQYSTNFVGPTYGNYRNPTLPGAGGTYTNAIGGGVASINVSGICTINNGSMIKANGASGGSINLKCAGFAGSAGANAITANGGNGVVNCSFGCIFLAGGGGGRIALISSGNNNSFTGSFAYPNNPTNLTAFKNVVRALGGAAGDTTTPGGGAGTIYLAHSGSNYGDLIVDNGLASPTVYVKSGTTFLPSLSGTVNGAPSGNTLPISVTSYPALTADYTDLYASLTIRPNLSFNNGTINNWADDNVLSLSSNDGTSLTMSSAISGVSNGDSFRSIDILDHIDIGGGAILETNGDIYYYDTTNPHLAATSNTNGLFKLNGSASTSATISTSITGGNIMQPAISHSGNLSVTGGTVETSNLTVSGNLSLSGTTKLKHPATTTTTVQSLTVNVSGAFSMSNTSSIDVSALGYTTGYSYGPAGPTTPLASTAPSGASHGGMGGLSGTSAVGLTYDDYRNPSLPGAGIATFAGGGVIRLIASNVCTINSGATIKANAGTYGAAGGSIYLKCGGFKGLAAANAITANGGNGKSVCFPTCSTQSGGGGGRIALISTGDITSFVDSFTYPNNAATTTSFKSIVRSLGGVGIDANTPGGGAGTIYLAHSGSTYGDLIIDNNNATLYANSGKTQFVGTTANNGVVSSQLDADNLQIDVAGNTPFANQINLFANSLIHVFAFTDPLDPYSPSHIAATVTSNDANILTAAGSNSVATPDNPFPVINSDYYYRFMHRLDHLEIGGKSIVNLNGGDLMLESPFSDKCDLHSSSAGAFDIPAQSSISGNSLGALYCVDALVTTKGSTVNFTNYFLH